MKFRHKRHKNHKYGSAYFVPLCGYLSFVITRRAGVAAYFLQLVGCAGVERDNDHVRATRKELVWNAFRDDVPNVVQSRLSFTEPHHLMRVAADFRSPFTFDHHHVLNAVRMVVTT